VQADRLSVRLLWGGEMVRDCDLHGTPSVLLRAGIAFGIVLSAATSIRAADLPVIGKAPAPVRGEFRVFVEGGAFWTGGDPIPFEGGGLEGDFIRGPIVAVGVDPSVKPKVGWDAAIGFDYRFAGTPWHVNGQFRYGEARGSNSFSSANSFTIIDPPDPTQIISISSSTAANLKEYHWQADFGAGYDLIAGPATMQVNFGIRIAEIKATNRVDSSSKVIATENGTPLGSETSSRQDEDVRSFLGIGPRVGIEGMIPLWGAFGFDYAANGAVLWGHSKIAFESVSAFSIDTPDIVLSASGITSGSQWSKKATVLNGDIQAGVSYWFTPNMKLGVSYRLDAFVNPLRAFPSNDPAVLDRYYHGPKVTLTGRL
jgi:opacity protein-like surface antigen